MKNYSITISQEMNQKICEIEQTKRNDIDCVMESLFFGGIMLCVICQFACIFVK